MQEASNDNVSVNEHRFKVPKASSWKPWLIASGAALAILAIALGLMWSLGLFEIPKEDTGTKTMAAALSLVGSVLSAVIILIGTVVKYSIDDRNAQLAAVEADRNHRLAVQAEKRNRIEAAIRAVDLLSENNLNTTEIQIGGAVLALVSLGELDLAVALLAQLWPPGLTSAHVAEVVLKQALKIGSEDTQISAATVLAQNAHQIQQEQMIFWPIGVLQWRTDLADNCRLGLVSAAFGWLKTELETDQEGLPNAAVVLYGALADPYVEVAEFAAASLKPLVAALPEAESRYKVGVADITERLKPILDKPFTFEVAYIEAEIQAILQAKEGEAPPPDPQPSDSGTR